LASLGTTANLFRISYSRCLHILSINRNLYLLQFSTRFEGLQVQLVDSVFLFLSGLACLFYTFARTTQAFYNCLKHIPSHWDFSADFGTSTKRSIDPHVIPQKHCIPQPSLVLIRGTEVETPNRRININPRYLNDGSFPSTPWKEGGDHRVAQAEKHIQRCSVMTSWDFISHQWRPESQHLLRVEVIYMKRR
jgi:hypothetical protein